MSGIESALEHLVGLVRNARRPLPNPNTLGGYQPVLTALAASRQEGTGVVWQKQGSVEKPFDGGDSDHRTGVLAFCGSKQDADNLPQFFNFATGLAVRHPNQPPWNNPNNYTRDQLTGYMAGCWRAGRTDIAQALFNAHERRGFTCQDFEDDYPGTTKQPPVGDLLAPHDIMYLRVCAGDVDAVSDIVGQLSMFTNIQILGADKTTEINQPLLQAIVCCQLDVFLSAHPNFNEQLIYYWEGEDGIWRQQREIADALINVVAIEKERYESTDVFDYLIPANILEEIRHIDLNEALNALKNANPIYFAELAGKLAIAALRDLKHAADVVIYGIRTLANIAEEVGTVILTAIQAEVTKQLKKLDSFLKDLDPLHSVAVALNTAARLLGLGSSDNEDERRAELQFRQDVLNGLQNIRRDTSQILTNIANLQREMEQNFAAIAVKVDGDFYKLVLSELDGKALAVSSVINSLTAMPAPSSGEKALLNDELANRVGALEASMGQCTYYGAPALAAAFHAYGLVITGITLLNNPVQLKQIKEIYRPQFLAMLNGANGLQATIDSLEKELTDGYKAFDKVRNKIIIGAANVRLAEQRNMDDTKDINAIGGYWTTKVFAILQGSIEAGPFSISYFSEDGGNVADQYHATDGEGGASVFAGAIFEESPWYGGRGLDKYHSPDLRERQINSRDTSVAKIRDEAGAALTQWLQIKRTTVINAKKILPGLRTMYAAVAATFDKSTTPSAFEIESVAAAFGERRVA